MLLHCKSCRRHACDVQRCMCVLSNVASALLSLLLSLCVRQSLNLAELLWEERQEGEGGSWMLWCLPSHVFPRAFVVIRSFSRPFALLWRRPFISTGWHNRIISVLACFLLCLSQNAIARKFDGSTTLLTPRGLRQATQQRAAVSTHSLLLHCIFCLQILVIDARGPNYWTANPTPICGIRGVKQPLQLLPGPEYDWIRQRGENPMGLSDRKK